MEKQNIFKEIRSYLKKTQEEMSRALGISVRTWTRWETQPILYSHVIKKENVKKIIELIKKEGNREFKEDFIKLILKELEIYEKEKFLKMEEELKKMEIHKDFTKIIEYINQSFEEFKNLPILQKILSENPEFTSLSFKDFLKKYSNEKLSYRARFLLNSLPSYFLEKLYTKKKNYLEKKHASHNNITKEKKGKKNKNRKKRKTGKRKRERKNKESDENSEDGDDEWIDIKEVSRITGIKVKTLYKYAENNKIPGYNYGRCWKFRKKEILEWTEKNKNILLFENWEGKQDFPPVGPFKKEEEMGLYRRGKIWWISRVINGKLIRISTGTTDLREAERILASLILGEEKTSEEKTANGRVTLRDVIENFIEYFLKSSRSFSYYVRSNLAKKKIYEFFGADTPASEITKQKVLQYKLWRKTQYTRYGKPPALSTLNSELRLLRAAWNKAIEMEIINLPNPCCQKGFIEKEKNQRDRVLKKEEEEKILKFFENHPEYEELKLAYLLSRYGAASRGEIVELKVADVNLIEGKIKFFRKKNKKIREILLHQILKEEIRKYLEKRNLPSDSPLLPSLDADKITDGFRRIVRRLGIKNLTFHDVRRTCIKELSIVEPNLYVLKKITGHSDILVLSHYIPVVDEDLKRVWGLWERFNFTMTQSVDHGKVEDKNENA